ncbi:hypothetical protein CAEBREN_01484 [Caenorhabditis brenneri]|uniref:SET domain-containing protein n=1 Tax=Caenorhabditis brenneri TaxID=135651 RepID=G0PGM3_CAEBE|nr:hypothetical protein CAEBREN_01484 [Caenorhabditis brenneri]
MAESLDGQGALLEEDIHRVWNELMEEFSCPVEEKEKEDEEVEDASDEMEEEGEDTLPPLEPLMGQGIKATRKIPVGLVFGPYLGTTTTDRRCENPHYSWWINGNKMTIDGYDQNISNWLRFVNSPNEETGANIKAIEYQGKIYYITIKVIQEKE